MRYLKAVAQDRGGNGLADTVIVHFYERSPNGIDELRHEAVAVDMNADELVDFQFAGDINFDGQSNVIDGYLLKAFANTFLQLNWFNSGESWQRTLVIAAIQSCQDGPPDGVQLNFLDRRSPVRKATLAYQAAGYDADGNGVLESFSRTDMDRNGVVDKADKALLSSMCRNFLAFKWYEQRESGV
ncbi:hypothetical protein C4K03_5964 [Pseudomonas synxantha]|uniref:Uncharacterized protein n=1 Tax=Pseudomonas synxantha TaxID=47883 RepID=A0A3G7UFY2_9PSED|nr:hypothetical protein [Pseudomonas synxantha]AZE58071.1 hypothetical protein C4K03_5964 [Pseudomonas synxantha]